MGKIQKFERAAKVLRVVAHPVRISIIRLLSKEAGVTVTAMQSRLGTTQSMMSQHLAALKAVGLVACRKQANECHYYLLNKNVLKLLDCVDHCTG